MRVFRRRTGAPKVWDMARLHVADKRAVRLSLPWHGPASWGDMHTYVTRVFMDNTVPGPDRAGYGAPEDQAASFARAVLLSVCHRLNIEPVGAYVFHGDRCPSCEHGADIHSDDGCWHTVARGRNGRDAVCACRVPEEELADAGGTDR